MARYIDIYETANGDILLLASRHFETKFHVHFDLPIYSNVLSESRDPIDSILSYPLLSIKP